MLPSKECGYTCRTRPSGGCSPANGTLVFNVILNTTVDLPSTWFVFPANSEAALPSEFVEHTVIPPHPVQMDPAVIEANRQSWLEQWSDIFR